MMKPGEVLITYWLNLRFEYPSFVTMCSLIGDDIPVLLIKRIES